MYVYVYVFVLLAYSLSSSFSYRLQLNFYLITKFTAFYNTLRDSSEEDKNSHTISS